MTSNTPEQNTEKKAWWARFICYACGLWLVTALICVAAAMERKEGMELGIPDIPAWPVYALSPYNPGVFWTGGEPLLGSVEATQKAHRWALCTGAMLLILVVAALRTRSLAAAVCLVMFLVFLSGLGFIRALIWVEELD